MKDYPLKLLPNYQEAYNTTFERLKKEFLESFSTSEGTIDLEKLAQINSGLKPSGRRTRRIKDEISDQLDIFDLPE